MSWSSIPNFGDPYAKINERTHTDSGARIIEVLYGARDASGRPTAPTGRADGHGHWVALEIDGVYQMLTWRHPAYENKGEEYGTDRSHHALADLERDIRKKETLCSRAEALSRSADFAHTPAEFARLTEEWKSIFYWRTPREKELWNRFRKAKDDFFSARDRERERNKAKKLAIISEAKALSYSTDWKAAGESFRQLFDRWKAVGPVSKVDSDALWSEFKAARQVFFDRRSKYFEQRDADRQNNRQKKQQLIAEARSISEYSTDWKSTGDALNGLMQRWKAVGSAGRDEDERLWSEFKGIRDLFYSRRRTHYQQLDSTFQRNAQLKAMLVQTADAIARSGDYSPSQAERMKSLSAEWKSIGYAGRNEDERLWSLFRNAQDSFWISKRQDHDRRQREWRMKTEAAIDRKRTQIANLESQIANLRDKMYTVHNPEYLSNMSTWISEKEAAIRELEYAINDMQRRL